MIAPPPREDELPAAALGALLAARRHARREDGTDRGTGDGAGRRGPDGPASALAPSNGVGPGAEGADPGGLAAVLRAELPEEAASDPWEPVLREVLVDGPAREGGPRALEVVGRLEEAGLPAEVAEDAAALLCAIPAVQRAWSAWTEIDDREELRLRLELVARFGDAEPVLVEFLLFHFRASDPGLYQPAAVAAGRHLGRLPALAEAIDGYADARGLRPDAPVPLERRRSHRRVLLAWTAAAGAPSPEGRSRPSPLAHGAPVGPAADDADWSAYLAALLLSLEAGGAEGVEIDVLAGHALARVPGEAPRPPSRATARRWGRLLVAVARRPGELRAGRDESPPEDLSDLWAAFTADELDAFRSASTPAFARRFRSLEAVDELLRTAAFAPPELREAATDRLDRGLSGEAGLFVRQRLRAWRDRVGAGAGRPDDDGPAGPGRPRADGGRGGAPSAGPAAGGDDARGTEHAGDGVDPLFRAVEASLRARRGSGGPSQGRLTETAAGRAAVRLVERLASWIEEPDRWASLSERRRCLIAFHLLDQTRWADLPEVRLAASLRSAGGFRVPSADPAATRRPRGEANAGTTAVLRRVIAWEGPGSERMVDARALHQSGDLPLLLSILPTRRGTEALAPLADVVENRLRSRLRADPDFDPWVYLYRLTVREPHPSFFRELARVVDGRSYQDAAGREVPVAEYVGRLAGRRAEGDGAPPRAPEEASGVAAAVRELRGEMVDAAAERELDDLLRRVTGLLARGVGRKAGRPVDLPSLLRCVAVPGEPLPRSGAPAWDGRDADAAAEELAETADHVSDALPALLSGPLSRIDEIRDAARTVDQELAELAEWVPAVLPGPEARAFSRLLEAAADRVAEWSDAVERLRRARTDATPDGTAASARPEARWRRLLDVVAEIGDAHLQRRSVDLLWGSVLADAGRQPDGPGGAADSSGVPDGTPREPAAPGSGDAAERPALPRPGEGEGARTGTARQDPWLREERLLRWAVDAGADRLEPDARERWHERTAASWARLAAEAREEGHETRASRLVRAPELRRLLPRRELSGPLSELRGWFLDCYRIADAARCRPERGLDLAAPIRAVAGFALQYSPVWLALMAGAVFLLDFGDPWTEMARVGDVRGIVLTALLGLAGAFGYIYFDLRRRVRDAPEDDAVLNRLRRVGRAAGFLGASLVYTLALTAGLWYLLSGTDEVVHGSGAPLHVVVWTGFALFVGIFLGLLTKSE